MSATSNDRGLSAKRRRDSSPTRLGAGRSVAKLTLLPPEMIRQIALSLGPGDLLTLARTCRHLRKMLMSKSYAPIWQEAEEMTPRLPRRPSELSSPQYAALVFSNYCTLCGGDKSVELEAALRVRLCQSCRVSELVDITRIKNLPHRRLTGMVPVTYKTRFFPGSSGDDDVMSIPIPHCLRKDLRDLMKIQKHENKS